ncbi:hypothetical protein MMC11_003323 [Xylographa trunciseda]|nr:hypothetical protein [Xylographa trunciseda]
MALQQDHYPDDILHEIFNTCAADRAAIYHLNLVSRQFHFLARPLLYNNVDLSYHDDGYFDPGKGFDWRYVYDTDEPVSRQHAFLRTLTDRPAYGRFVRSFKWTLSWSPKDERQWPIELQEIELTTWNVFRSLAKVKTVDFGCLALHCSKHSALRLHVFGLAAAIMHSVDPATLESITLDDLQDVGQYPNGLPIAEDHAADLRLIKESTRPDGSRGLVFPGPMRELLRPLQGQCSNLKFLYIRRCGQKLIQDDGSEMVWSNTAEEGAYMEYASFLDSVKSSLRSFHFEQGHEAPAPSSGVLPL